MTRVKDAAADERAKAANTIPSREPENRLPNTQAETHAKTHADMQAETHAVTQADVQVETHAKTHADVHAVTQADVQAETHAKTHADVRAETHAVTQADVQAKTHSKTHADVRTETQIELEKTSGNAADPPRKLGIRGLTTEYRAARAASGAGEKEGSEDYLFDGYISYLFSVYIDLDRNMDYNLRSNLIIESLQEFFPKSILDTDNAAGNEPILNDIRLVQGFLHGDGLPFECRRLLLKDFDLEFLEFPMEGTGVLVSVFPEFNTVQIYFFFRAEHMTTDQLIYLRQIFNGAAPFLNRANGRKGSLSYHFQRIADHLGAKVVNREQMYLLELRRISRAGIPVEEASSDSSFPGDADFEQFMESESRRIYGMLCGDEGWEFVPEELARERLSHTWGSREFVKFFAFGNNAILFNMIDSASGDAYRIRQTGFGTEAYGAPNEYFFLKSEAAGVNHGIFFGQETIMVIKTIAANIMSRQANRRLSIKPSLRTDLRLTKEFRAELITTINKVENLGISEMGELEQMLINNFRISPLIESIKYLLEMLESDLDLLYQQDTNRKVNLLTIFGLLISVMAFLVDILGLFK